MGAPSTYEMNLNRISMYIDTLTGHVNRIQQIDPAQFCNLCFSLARCIDFAIANGFVPPKIHGLPSLLKKMCQKEHSHQLKAAILVLMISAKNACKMKWFSENEAEELYSLANEIGSDFFVGANTGQSESRATITAVMERFFPQLKLGQIITSLDVKPGYGVFPVDFIFSKTTQFSPHEKIRLFVAQKDNTDTSACLISPPQVNFLVNGRGVNGRTNTYMDTGPQLPTNVTHMLQLGSNLLQAVGSFNGHYVIAVATMGTAPSPDSSLLQDHVHPVVSTVDSDSDIIEGPSRISLNCPISCTRIKVPVKGRSCKHHQCFDFYNFIEINSRRPSWRCPHCNQYICFLDIRVDQNMLKVIGEVADNITEVIISADGSWKAILENDSGDGRPLDDSRNLRNEREQQEPTAPNLLDLTEVDDDINIFNLETEDRKPCLGNKNQPVSSSLNNRNSLGQNLSADLDDDFWSGLVNDGILTSSTRSNAQVSISPSAPNFVGRMPSAVMTDAVTPVHNRGVGVPGHVTLPSPALCDQNNLQSQALNSNENNQYGRVTSIARRVSRTPTAVQALPSQSQGSGQQYRSRTPAIPSASQAGSSIPTNRDGLNIIPRDSERRQQLPSHPGDSHHATNPAPFHHPPTKQMLLNSQNRDPQVRSFTPGQSVQASNASRANFQNPRLQQASNVRIPYIRNQVPNNVRSSLPFSRPTSQAGGGHGGSAYSAASQHARMVIASQRAAVMRQSSAMSLQNQSPRSAHSLQTTTPVGVRIPAGELRNVGAMSQPVTTATGSVDPSAEQNWQPSGRMRGSLTGRANSDAYGHLIIQPTQSVQSVRPPSNGLDTHGPRTQ